MFLIFVYAQHLYLDSVVKDLIDLAIFENMRRWWLVDEFKCD